MDVNLTLIFKIPKGLKGDPHAAEFDKFLLETPYIKGYHGPRPQPQKPKASMRNTHMHPPILP